MSTNRPVQHGSLETGDSALKASVTRSTSLRVIPVQDGMNHQQPVHAINWFDTRSLWLYNVYNALAARSVRKVKGVPLYKARLQETLWGDPALERETLLLVRYPDAISFTSMLANRHFQITSLLREVAVKRFTFGLSDASLIHLSGWGSVDNASYLVYHWTDSVVNNTDIRSFIQKAAKIHNVEVVFDARITYKLGIQKEKPQSHLTHLPCLMDECILLRHQQADALRACFANSEFEKSATSAKHSFAGLMKRIA